MANTETTEAVAIAGALEILATAPKHGGHSHGVLIGLAQIDDPDSLVLVVVHQGSKRPCWVQLDDDDLADLDTWVSRTRLERQRLATAAKVN